MWLWLKKRGIHHNPKTILRIMRKYDLLAEIRRRRKWIQMGQQLHKWVCPKFCVNTAGQCKIEPK